MKRVIFWLVILLSFTMVGVWVLNYAMGYRYNFTTRKFQKTGTLIISSRPNFCNIYLDNILIGQKTPLTYRFVLPGLHHLKITKDGYHTFEKTIEILAGRVYEAENIRLFLTNIGLTPSQQALDVPQSSLPTGGDWPAGAKDVVGEGDFLFYTVSDELRWRTLDGQNDQLITRFSSPIEKIAPYPGGNYIFALVSQKLMVLEKEGGNLLTLLTLPAEYQAIQMIASRAGDQLFIKLDQNLYVAQVL